MDQITVGTMQFDDVEPGLMRAPRTGGKAGNCGLHGGGVHRLRRTLPFIKRQRRGGNVFPAAIRQRQLLAAVPRGG